MQGEEQTNTFDEGGYCAPNGAGIAVICVSSDEESAWNTVQSDFSWESFSSMSTLESELSGPQYYEPGFSPQQPWLAPSATNTGFQCDDCDTVAEQECRTYDKVWGAECSLYGYFRKPV